MKNTILFASCLLTLFFICPHASHAVRLYNKGYEVDVMWKEKKNKLIVWGAMHGGNVSCEQMECTFLFKNITNKNTKKAKATIKRYTPTGRNNFKLERYISSPSRNKFHVKGNQWQIKDHWVKCYN